MLAAMKEADRIGAPLVFGDRDVNDTLREIKAAFSPSLLMKIMTAGPPPPEIQSIMMDMVTGGIESLGDNVELLKTRENARALSTYMTTAAPDIANVLIHRRDEAMATNLHKHCGEGKVVAVVGLAHVDGIEREWQAIENTRTKQPKLGS
jgi:pheromone shutdown protein TraB